MAVASTTVWEVRSTADSGNGGGFNPARGGGGVDYSQQDSAQLSLSDIVTNGTTTITSVAGGFTAQMVGNLVHLVKGALHVYREIVSYTDTNTVVLDSSVVANTGVSGKVGGALDSPEEAINGHLDYPRPSGYSGSVIWIKAHPLESQYYGLSGAEIINHVTMYGYYATRGDSGSGGWRPLLWVNSTLGVCPIGNYAKIKHLRFDSTTAFSFGTYTYAVNCQCNLWELLLTDYFVHVTTSYGTGSVFLSTEDATGTGDLDLHAATLDGSGQFLSTHVTGRGDGGIASGGPTLPASYLGGVGSFLSTTVTADSGDLDLAPLVISGSGSFTPGTVTSPAGELDLGAFYLTGVGTVTVPTSTSDSGELDLGAIVLAGTGTFDSPVRTGTGSLDLLAIYASGTGTFQSQGVSSATATAFTTSPNLLTYRDCIEHLVTFADGLAQEADQNRARSAVQAAYRDLALSRKWKYLQTHYRLQFSAPYSTGTVAYNSSTRVLTLTSGTFPSWAANGHLSISGLTPVYKVASRTDTTHLVLDSVFCPQANVAAGTSYTLWRSVYDLPGDLAEMEEIVDENYIWSAGYLSPNEWMALERRFRSNAKPFRWTVFGSPESYGQMSIATYGYPSTAQSMDFFYTRRPRMLRLDGYDLFSSADGTSVVSVDTVGTVVTFSSTFIYEAAMQGAVLRMGRPGTTTIPKGFGQVGQWWQQKIISTSGSSANNLTVDSSIAGGFGQGYTISDPVDMADYLHDALLVGCEYYYLLRVDPARARQHQGFYRQAKIEAMGRDHMVPLPDAVAAGPRFHDPAWRLLTGSITPS